MQLARSKSGFGEGTPQQVRPVIETQFQLLKLWPQVDTCLSLFPSEWKIQISNWISVSKAGSAGANRSVSCLWSPLAPNLRSCPCVAAALSGSPAFCAGSWRGIQIQTAHVALKVRSMKNCRPVVRLQILSGYLSGYKKPPRKGPKDFVVGVRRQNGSVWLRSGCLAY